MFLAVPFLGVVSATWSAVLHAFDPDDELAPISADAGRRPGIRRRRRRTAARRPRTTGGADAGLSSAGPIPERVVKHTASGIYACPPGMAGTRLVGETLSGPDRKGGDGAPGHARDLLQDIARRGGSTRRPTTGDRPIRLG